MNHSLAELPDRGDRSACAKLYDDGAEEVRVYDFIDPELVKVAPHGVYDLTNNNGWVNVGIDHDTAEFAVESIRRWWPPESE